MTDIVERLRGPASLLDTENGTALLWEAADEIERLRHQNGLLEAEIERLHDPMREAIFQAGAEGTYPDDVIRCLSDAGYVIMPHFEVERLRDALFLSQQDARNYKTALWSHVENIYKPHMANAEKEIERLRAVLEAKP